MKDLALKALRKFEKTAPSLKKECPEIEADLYKLGSKIPKLNALEKKLKTMKQLKPNLKNLIKEIDIISDMRDIKVAEEGGKSIKKVLDAESSSAKSKNKQVK